MKLMPAIATGVAYSADHLAGLRAVLLHAEKFNAAVPEILANGVLSRSDIGC